MTRIFVAGHKGMVGSALCRQLAQQPGVVLLTADRLALDLLDQRADNAWFAEHQPEQVYLAAAKVGGIHANNTFPAEFVYQNLQIEANLIHAAHTQPMLSHINVGTGVNCTIRELAETVAKVTGELTLGSGLGSGLRIQPGIIPHSSRSFGRKGGHPIFWGNKGLCTPIYGARGSKAERSERSFNYLE